jgi:hypothetical protein
MKRAANAAIAGSVGLAILCLVGCSTTHHVKETTTTKEYDAPDIQPVPPPSSGSATTTTTQYDNGTVQERTVTHPNPSISPSQTTTTVTTDTDNGNVQKRTTTTYSNPDTAP